MDVVVYADFTDADCYLASRRVDALRAAGVPVDWRAVEHDPTLPVTGRRLPPAGPERLAELTGQLLPGESLPWQPPSVVYRTEAAVSGYAEAYCLPIVDDVRRLLFELYWVDGLDIGSPTVLRTPLAGPFLRSGSPDDPLREQGFAVSVDRGPITTAAHQRIRNWRAEWQALGAPELPVLFVDGAVLVGRDAVRRLGKLLAYLDIDPAPDAADPRRYPTTSVHPDPRWTSQVGGPWRFSHRAA